MMNDEKPKKAPAISPQASAVQNVKTISKLSLIGASGLRRAHAGHGEMLSSSPRLFHYRFLDSVPAASRA